MLKLNLLTSLTILLLTGTLVGCGGSQSPSEDQAETLEVTEVKDAALAEVEVQATQLIDKSDPNWKVKVTEPPMMTFEADKTYKWELNTNFGTMTFRLFHEESPKHVNSTIYLTNIGFYDDVIFHRVIPGFMAQGGDPTGTGRGGPAYRYAGEFEAGLSHNKPGLLSMANAGPNTDGSQFFITFVPTPFLDNKHTIFGELISGMEVLKAFEARGSRSGQTSEKLAINTAKIIVE